MGTNSMGLTWEEWLQASGHALFDRYGFRESTKLYTLSLRKAFLNGEDPTEYRTPIAQPVRASA